MEYPVSCRKIKLRLQLLEKAKIRKNVAVQEKARDLRPPASRGDWVMRPGSGMGARFCIAEGIQVLPSNEKKIAVHPTRAFSLCSDFSGPGLPRAANKK